MSIAKAEEASRIAREHVVRVLLEQVERTFSTEGQAAGLRFVADLFGRMDESALRELAYQFGLTTEAELEPEANDRRE